MAALQEVFIEWKITHAVCFFWCDYCLWVTLKYGVYVNIPPSLQELKHNI